MKTSAQAGFTLVEVLITLVIFAFGMLGVAALQMVSLTNLDTSQYRSLASLKAAEMADRMRANAGLTYVDVVGADGSCRATHYADSHAAPVTCGAPAMAADDVYDWKAELAGRLPSGEGVICLDSTPDDGLPTATACDGIGTALAVKVWWTERPTSAAAAIPKRSVISMVR